MTLEFFGELYDHRILLKFLLDLITILQDIDDHRIIVKIFIYFDQNSFSQPYHPKIQMTLKFSRIVWQRNSCEICHLIIILQEIDDHRIIVNIFIDFRQILLSSLIIPQFKCLLNSSRIVWLKNSCAIFPGLYHNSSTSRWPQNYCENFHLFWSEFF